MHFPTFAAGKFHYFFKNLSVCSRTVCHILWLTNIYIFFNSHKFSCAYKSLLEPFFCENSTKLVVWPVSWYSLWGLSNLLFIYLAISSRPRGLSAKYYDPWIPLPFSQVFFTLFIPARRFRELLTSSST